MTKLCTHPIDIVFTWVDGNDPAHQAKMRPYLAGTRYRSEATTASRFKHLGEIDYAVMSVLKFAPFVRRIYIVTDAQTPPIYKRSRHWPPLLRDKLVLIDHKEIFNDHEYALPTFNSRSIETMLWRIEGLAEHFVFLNDDFFLLRQISPNDWFIDGQPVLRGEWSAFPSSETRSAIALRTFKRLIGLKKEQRPTHERAQVKAAKATGSRSHYFRVNHTPYPMRKSTLISAFDNKPRWLKTNIHHKFRHADQFHPASLANHLEIFGGTATLTADAKSLYIDASRTRHEDLCPTLKKMESCSEVLFTCVQNLDQGMPEITTELLAGLDRLIGRTHDA